MNIKVRIKKIKLIRQELSVVFNIFYKFPQSNKSGNAK